MIRKSVVITLGGVLLFVGLPVAVWALRHWGRSAQGTAGVIYRVERRAVHVVIGAKGTLKAAKSTDIRSEIEGRPTIIWVIPEGEPVKEGDSLITLASKEIEDRISRGEIEVINADTAHRTARSDLGIQIMKNDSDIRKADLEIKIKQRDQEKYLKEWEQRKYEAEIAIKRAEISLVRSKEAYESNQRLREKGYITPNEFTASKIEYQTAEWELEKAGKAKLLGEYTHDTTLLRQESDLAEAKAERDRTEMNAQAEGIKKESAVDSTNKQLDVTRNELEKLRRQLEKCRIKAPTQGFVVYWSEPWWSDDQRIKVGAMVYEGKTLLQLPDITTMIVALRIPEAWRNRLIPGQTAEVTVEGLPGLFTGKVTKIAPLPDSQGENPDIKEYETEITLDPTTDANLTPGLTAHAEIMVQTVENSLAVPVQAVYTKAAQCYVFRERHGEIEPIPVHLGARATDFAEITDGLAEGDNVLLAFSDDQKRLIPDVPAGERRKRADEQVDGRDRAPRAMRDVSEGKKPEPERPPSQAKSGTPVTGAAKTP